MIDSIFIYEAHSVNISVFSTFSVSHHFNKSKCFVHLNNYHPLKKDQCSQNNLEINVSPNNSCTFSDKVHWNWNGMFVWFQIISREEASKRRMTILECEMNLPLPELVGESNLLSNDHVRKVRHFSFNLVITEHSVMRKKMI